MVELITAMLKFAMIYLNNWYRNIHHIYQMIDSTCQYFHFDRWYNQRAPKFVFVIKRKTVIFMSTANGRNTFIGVTLRRLRFCADTNFIFQAQGRQLVDQDRENRV